MAYKLQITDKNLNLNFNVKYENLAKTKRPPVIAKAPDNKTELKEKMVIVDSQGQVLQGKMGRRWMDDAGGEYGKTELTFWFNDEQVLENQQTKIFEVEGYQPVENYTDKYVISTYYELAPSTNDLKKDIDRQKARSSNLHQMRKLWEYLHNSKQVARGEFCPSSRGFMASDGYIRAIYIDNSKWGLEIGVFKEEKVFQHLEEKIPAQGAIVGSGGRTGKRIKMVHALTFLIQEKTV